MTLASCEYGSNLGGNNGGSEEIEIPLTGDYISFWTDIETRANLVTTDYIEQPLGLICYTYDPTNSWGAYQVSAKPDVYALGEKIVYIEGLGETQEYPRKLEYDGGTYTYGEPVSWESMKYAFFAYTPYGHSKVVPSEKEVEKTPYVTYTLDTSNAANHADVITGYAVNCYAAINKYVTFRMRHRLSAVDIAAVNYYDYSYQSGEDTDKNPIYTTEKVTIEIESMTARFTNLKYGSSKIYLDHNIASVPEKLASDKIPIYPIVVKEDGYELQPSTSSEFDYISVDQETTMLFIPQEDDIEKAEDNLIVDVEVNYKKRRPGNDDKYLWTVVETVTETVTEDGIEREEKREYKVDIPAGSAKEYIEDIDPNPDVKGTITVLGCYRDEHGNYIDGVFTTTQTATFEQSLEEEYRYYALLTFTSHAVSINILTAAAWNENVVDYEFD